MKMAVHAAEVDVPVVVDEKEESEYENSDSDAGVIDIDGMFIDRISLIKKRKELLTEIYTIGRVIGLGSYGEVRKVEHRQSKHIRCLKSISKNLFGKKYIPRIEYQIEL
jgi:serine/threonine protein kinase